MRAPARARQGCGLPCWDGDRQDSTSTSEPPSEERLARAVHDLTDAQWAALRQAWGGCAYCGAAGVPLQRDCVLPISRGGRYTLENVVPACRACNTSKGNHEVTSWLRRKHLDEQAFLLGHLKTRVALADTTATSHPHEH